MGVFHLNKLPKQKRIQMIGEFYDLIDSLKNRKEVRAVFKDLLSGDEIACLMRRIEVSVLILNGFTYEQIKQLLGVGCNKIVAIHKTISKEGEGYKIAMRNLLKDREKRLSLNDKGLTTTWQKMKKKRPIEFLLFNLLETPPKKISSRNLALRTPSRKF